MLISSIGAYAITAYLRGPSMPWIGFVFLMGHLSLNHVTRQYINRTDIIDITGQFLPLRMINVVLTQILEGAQMVLVMKVSVYVP